MVEAKQARDTDAIESYAKAFKLNAESPEANFNLARFQSLAGMTEKPKELLSERSGKFPRGALTYQDHALMLLRLCGSGDAVLETCSTPLLKAAMAQAPSRAEPHYQLGNLRLRKGQIAKAFEEHQAPAKLEAKDPRVHYALSRVYRHLGQHEEASKEVSGPRNAQVRRRGSDRLLSRGAAKLTNVRG